MIERIICLIIGYVFGLFQTSYIYGKMKGIDIRAHGSGNAGATNALRTLGAKAGVLTFFGDALKCVFAVVLTRLIFAESHSDIVPILAMYSATGVILGHNYPFFLNFRGGKGIAATGGMMFSMNLILTLICAALFAVVFITTHYVSIGSMLVYLTFAVGMFVLGETGMLGITDRAGLTEIYVLVVLLTVLAVWKHRQNIIRLIHGNENKTYFKKK